MKLIFVRHGEPDYANNTLTENGFKEVKSLGNHYSDEDFDYVYCSPLQRSLLTAKAVIRKKEIIVLDWLKEFEGKITIEGKEQIAWDIMPRCINDNEDILSNEYFQSNIIKGTNVKINIEKIYNGFDKLLAKHGYIRNKNCYVVKKPNDDTIVIFCHFCLMSILMSRLFNVPYLTIALNTFIPPTGLTTFISEEREKGYANFRMINYGNVNHLIDDGIPISQSGRFIEYRK